MVTQTRRKGKLKGKCEEKETKIKKGMRSG